MEDVRYLLFKAGLPFDTDEQGFPHPGQVVKFFREQMIYILPDGNRRKWTQADLAGALGLSEVSIRAMENNHAGLDSISRRRIVADLLKIPPVLLGLGTIEDLHTYVKHHEFSETTLKAIQIEKPTISLYQDVAVVFWEKHYTGTVQHILPDLQRWVMRIDEDRQKTRGEQQRQLATIICSYYLLLGHAYNDLCNYAQASEYLHTAMELATTVDNAELKAAILYWTGASRLEQRKFALAKTSLDGALMLAEHARPSLKGAIFQTAGLAQALVKSEAGNHTYVQSLLDKAEMIVKTDNLADDPYYTRLSTGRFYLEKADALLAMGKARAALDVLDDADEQLAPNQTRRHAYIDILRAEAYMNMRKPEWDTATTFLVSALKASKIVQSDYNIQYILRLYQPLSQSSYSNAPDVRMLGRTLTQWQQERIYTH